RLRAERLWPTAGRVAKLAGKEANDARGDVVLLRVGLEVDNIRTSRCEGEREVAHHLRGWRDLWDPTENAVCGRVVILDRLEVVALPDGNRLLSEVRELTARDFVVVHPSGRTR